MNEKQHTGVARLIWFVLILQAMTIVFMISTRLIDADMRKQYQRSITRYEKQAEKYEKQAERYEKAMTEYEKQKTQYEKDMEEYRRKYLSGGQ